MLTVIFSFLSVLHANPFRVATFEENGQQIDKIVVPGSPPRVKMKVVAVPEAHVTSGVNALSKVPAFTWCYGCSATSAAMMMGYYDNNEYPDMYTGPANGGVCPLNNETYWGHTAYGSVTCGECPLSATHQGKDGRSSRGHVDDFWVDYDNSGNDPYISGGWNAHTPSDCTGDFMGTNQSKYDNSDGATTFYYDSSGSPLYDYTRSEPSGRDGCHGIRLFVESRGYTVSANFNQYIYGYGGRTQGFTFAAFQSEVDGGRPVLIHIEGHTMLGYGYNSSGSLIYIHDTWDNSNHSMVWGGTYDGMTHYGVTVVQLDPAVSIPSAPISVSATDGSSTANATVSWAASSGATSYSVWRGTSSSSSSAMSLSSSVTTTSYADTSATPGVVYYYWVKAINASGTSGFSSSNTGYRSLSVPTGVSATDGTLTTGVNVIWSSVSGASYYRVYRAATSGGSKTALGSWQTALSYLDTSAVAGTPYYYFVMAAIDASGTRPSTYSSYNAGYRATVAIPAAPTNVSAADGTSTANVTVTWTASSGATSYSVWRGTSSSSSSATSLSSSVAATSYADTTAIPGTTYYYWAKASNSAGTSAYSSSNTGYRTLTAPSISATTTDSSKVRISWASASGASYYRVSRATTSVGTKTVISSGWQSALSLSDATGIIGTTYYYFVEAAVDVAGTRPSAYSSYATGKRPLPVNDAFASAVARSGNAGSASGPNEGATKQTGEPEHNGEATAVNSVWWTWTAPSSGQAIFDTVGSSFDTVLAIYTGTAVGSLTAVASNDDAVGLASRVAVNTTAGTVYRIAVAGYGGEYGTVVLNWSFVSAIEPTIKGSGITTISGTMYYQVGFKVKAGKTYYVQRTDSLTSPSWANVSTVSATADGVKTVNIIIPSNKPTGYYRVKTTE